MKLSKAYAAMLLAVISGTTMAAGSATANFQATATLNNACTVSSSNVDFGVIDATHNQGQGNITAHCTKGTTYNINVSAGTSGSYAARSMKAATSGNTDVVLYNLYTDTSYAAAKSGKIQDGVWALYPKVMAMIKLTPFMVKSPITNTWLDQTPTPIT